MPNIYTVHTRTEVLNIEKKYCQNSALQTTTKFNKFNQKLMKAVLHIKTKKKISVIINSPPLLTNQPDAPH